MAAELPPLLDASDANPLRCYRDLSQKLLTAANRINTRRDFAHACLRYVCDFTASDRCDLWIRQNSHQIVGWSLTARSGPPASLGRLPLTSLPMTDPIPQDTALSGYRSRLHLPLLFAGQTHGQIVLYSTRPNFFPPAKQDIYQDIAINLAAAAAYQQVRLEQKERVKELTCLYQIARLSAAPSASGVSVLEGMVEMLPPAMQYSSIAVARAQVDEHVAQTEGFEQAIHILKAPIVVDGVARGSVQVGYTESTVEVDDGPFLVEERHLLEAVAREIGRIWQQRLADQEQRRLREQVRHADRLATIGQLAAGVAHELNEPLSSILGFAQLCIQDPEVPLQVQEDLGRIEAAALHSREVVRRLSLFARQAPTKRRPLFLGDVVREGLFLIESRCRKEGIDLEVHLDEDLPAIVADAGQLTQVLLNLAVNAIQAMSEGGRLTVATERIPNGVLLRVSDTGPGIPSEIRSRIFEPFFTTKEVGQGTGLGLSVVHGIVQAHGGDIRVDSHPGRGTTFLVEFPAE